METQERKIYVSELSSTRHVFGGYHFCHGYHFRHSSGNGQKTRIGVILQGSGTYLYLNKKLEVREGDLVFIPENIYCYSEWRGAPDIEVVYVSGFLHYERFRYEPQILSCRAEVKDDLLQISSLLLSECGRELEAYSIFYRVLQEILPAMVPAAVSSDKTLQSAMEYITDNWDKDFSVGDAAKACCVSESTLYHLFQKELGQTPVGFLNSIRINKAVEYLENTQYSISTVSRLAGFHSENHFRKVFSLITGTTPLKFRKGR